MVPASCKHEYNAQGAAGVREGVGVTVGDTVAVGVGDGGSHESVFTPEVILLLRLVDNVNKPRPSLSFWSNILSTIPYSLPQFKTLLLVSSTVVNDVVKSITPFTILELDSAYVSFP